MFRSSWTYFVRAFRPDYHSKFNMREKAKSDQSKVFVAIPSYNHGRFVEECIRSVIAQTQPPLKLLVIDDGSSDGSPDRIGRVLNGCPFDCELIARENRGLCATLNQALSLSSGEYFAYLGSDDFWMPGFLDTRTSMLDQKIDSVLAFGHAYLVDEFGTVLKSTEDDRRASIAYATYDAKQLLYKFR